jgi:hypothetical protein
MAQENGRQPRPALQVSFQPETALFRPGGVNLRVCLRGVPVYASAQSLDFFAGTKNASLPDWKPAVSHQGFPDGHKIIIPWSISCNTAFLLLLS